jgi:RNA polymerase sigma factor (sigma-70 family)
MRKRQNLVEKYSTFLKFINRNGRLLTNWEPQPKLEIHMKRMVELDPEAKEDFWTQYWLKESLKPNSDQLAKGHLSAYLEETCYWTAITTAQKLGAKDFTWMDCLQIARATVANPGKLFAKYESNRGSIKNYSELKLKTAILEVVRVGRSKKKYTDAALLRVITKTALSQGLEKAGILPEQLPRYILSWRCFKEIYIPTKAVGSQKLEWPDGKQIEAIANRYNQLCSRSSLPEITNAELETLLKTSVKAVRDTTAPSIRSLDESDLQLPAPDEDFWESESQASEWHQVNSTLSNTFNALPKNDQIMLELEHGLALKQADIGKLFNVKQYQVSRQLDKAKRVLVKALVEWSQQELKISLNPQQIGAIATQIDGWLDWYLKSRYSEKLSAILLQNFSPDLELLNLYYGQNIHLQSVAKQMGIPESLVTEKLLRVKQELSEQFQNQVQTNLGLQLNSIPTVSQRISTGVETWLKNAPYATFSTEPR